MEDIALIYTTFGTHEDAAKTIETLIEEGLAGCGNIMAPHTAIYPWKDELKQDEEFGSLIKAPHSKKAALIKRLEKIHPYELPCILEIDAAAVPAFAKWLKNPI